MVILSTFHSLWFVEPSWANFEVTVRCICKVLKYGDELATRGKWNMLCCLDFHIITCKGSGTHEKCHVLYSLKDL